jgi:hypothetical protein
MNDRTSRVIASVCLGIGGAFGMAGTFAPSPEIRGLCWGIDGTALVVAAAILAILYIRKGDDLVAAGFLVFGVGQGIVVSSAAADLAASIPSFGAGTALWAAGLALVSVPAVLPIFVRVLGLVAALAMAATAVQIFAGAQLDPMSRPLPFAAYPLLVATMVGWIWTLLRRHDPKGASAPATAMTD